jgi:hypothetical protein
MRWAVSSLPSRTYTLNVPTEMNVDIDILSTPHTRTTHTGISSRVHRVRRVCDECVHEEHHAGVEVGELLELGDFVRPHFVDLLHYLVLPTEQLHNQHALLVRPMSHAAVRVRWCGGVRFF